MMITEFGPIGPALSLVAVAGVIVSYLLLRREMRAEISRLREMVGAQGASERSSREAAVESKAAAEITNRPASEKKKQQAPVPVAAPAKEEITTEILAVISAAVAQFLGAGARIRSTRLIASPGGMSPWAQQGRVIIQASHNLGMR